MNSKHPPFKFALSPDAPPLTLKSDRWLLPLPASRHAFSPSHCDVNFEGGTTYGDYFTAAQQFLAQDNFSLLCHAAGQLVGKAVALADIRRVSIYLVKHGAFYHPACVVVDLLGQRLAFVLNVAVAAQGRKIITQEYHSLSQLNTELAGPFWPQAFGLGQGRDLKGRPLPMFLGQWLDGFYEFHLTGETSERRQVVVWDGDHGHHMLSSSQATMCMQQAALILTYAYNPLTTETIGSWHHAAGDFVLALAQDRITLRLITVRNYSPMMEDAHPDVAFVLEALLVHLMQISIKLRLDRLDGIGSVACHGAEVVPAICRGFFQGLQMAAPLRGLPEDFDTTVKAFMRLHGADHLMPIALAIQEAAAFTPEERDLVRRFLKRHVSVLIDALAA